MAPDTPRTALCNWRVALLTGAALFLFANAGQAAEPPQAQPSRADLLKLARQFVGDVDYGFERADDYLDKVNGRENLKAIPDGEMLLLQVSVGGRKGIIFNQPLVAIKQGDDVLVSLFDFVNVAQFAIDVKPLEKKAEGWFIRQNRRFMLDGAAMKIEADGQTYNLTEDDILVDDADILISSAMLSKVFGFKGDVSLRYQRLDVAVTADKWPAVERIERALRRKNQKRPPVEQPLQEEPYRMVSVPNVDFSTSYDFSRAGQSGEIKRSRSHNAVIGGDLLGHTVRAVTSGDQMHALQTLSATFKKESDQPELLGRMKAREYEFGDISAVNVPGAVGKKSGVGFRATNRNPYETSDAITEIEGDIAPGWDVELYRGSQYLDVISNADGKFRFRDVQLSAGENKFRLLKYGPLGEIEEEEFTIFSTPRKLTETKDLYEVSVNASDTVLWSRQTPHSHDKYVPIVAGTLEHQLTMDTSVKGGVFTGQQEGHQKTYFHGGGATYWGGTILNAGTTFDWDGAFTSSVTARRNIFGQGFSAGASFKSADYGLYGGQKAPSEYTLDILTRGALPTIFDFNLGNYTVSTSYTENADDRSIQESKLSWSGQLSPVSFSHNLTHNLTKSPESESEELTGRSSFGGRVGRTRWRATTEYKIHPEWHIDTYNLDLSRRLAEDVNGQLLFENIPDTDFTQMQAKVIWNHDNFALSPSLGYNTNRDITATITANVGLAYDEDNNKIAFSGKKISDMGGVSAFVYLDKDGDRMFTEGDEPIQDALVEAIQTRKGGNTDEDGQAFIYELPSDVITDVKLNEYSLFDPFYVSANPGVSIRPRAGHDARIEFPVHNGGELDGTIYVRMPNGKERSGRNLRLHLFDINGNLVGSAATSFDGFFLFQKIHPGDYWLMVDEKDARNSGLIRPLPEKLSFGYDGTLLYGHKIFMRQADEGEVDTPLVIGENYESYINENPSVDVALIRENRIVFNFGTFSSRAMMSLVWYKLKSLYGNNIRGAELLVPLSQTNPAGEDNKHALRATIPDMTMAKAHALCKALMARNTYCRAEILPSGLEKQDPATMKLTVWDGTGL
ncbi:MAG: hypothetical protein ACK4NR_00255 [Micavibrio sp.]